MSGSNNFLQWNPNAANQDSDAAYTADSLRSGGATVAALLPSATFNKVLFQQSTMVAALAAMMAAKNFNMLDSNFANLQTALSNLLTTADGVFMSSSISINIAAKGHIKIGTFVLQWAAGTQDAAPAGNVDNDYVTQTIAWDIAFPTACVFAFPSCQLVTPNVTSDLWYQIQAWNANNATVIRCRSHNDAGREGDYNSATIPLVIGIGN